MAGQDSYAEVARVAADRIRAGENIDDVIRFMRNVGFSMIDCMQALDETEIFPAGDTKVIVHNSEAWADRREAHDQFHEALEREIADNQSN